jgi:hypothetical protein
VLGQFDPSDWLSLRVTASIPPTAENCAGYCDGNAGCASQCVSDARALVASQRLSQAEIRAIDQQSGAIAFPVNLRFDSVAPAFTSTDQPDLVVNSKTLQDSVEIKHQSFAADSCAIAESCVGGAGQRALLRFDSEITNVGGKDISLGEPESNPLFQFSACHQHYHFGGVMSYELYQKDAHGNLLPEPAAVGHKQGFCLMDEGVAISTEPGKYNCEDQGITVGWSDVYDRALDCQWVDVTGLAPGDYVLRLVVNPDGVLNESDRTNNVTEISVTLKPQDTQP